MTNDQRAHINRLIFDLRRAADAQGRFRGGQAGSLHTHMSEWGLLVRTTEAAYEALIQDIEAMGSSDES